MENLCRPQLTPPGLFNRKAENRPCGWKTVQGLFPEFHDFSSFGTSGSGARFVFVFLYDGQIPVDAGLGAVQLFRGKFHGAF